MAEPSSGMSTPGLRTSSVLPDLLPQVSEKPIRVACYCSPKCAGLHLKAADSYTHKGKSPKHIQLPEVMLGGWV